MLTLTTHDTLCLFYSVLFILFYPIAFCSILFLWCHKRGQWLVVQDFGSDLLVSYEGYHGHGVVQKITGGERENDESQEYFLHLKNIFLKDNY